MSLLNEWDRPEFIYGWTMLHWACKWQTSHLEALHFIKSLVETKSDINAKNDHDVTPLMVAYLHADNAVIDYLQNQGAFAGYRTKSGFTALDLYNLKWQTEKKNQ